MTVKRTREIPFQDSPDVALETHRLVNEGDLGYSHPIDPLKAAVQSGSQAHLSGLHGGYLAATLAQLYDANKRPLLIITPTYDTALSLQNDLATFGMGTIDQDLLLLPDDDVSPYSGISPNQKRVLNRLNVQLRLASNDDVRGIIAPIGGLMRKTIPLEFLHKGSTTVHQGTTDFDLEQFRVQLVASGYAPVRVVEDPGSFTVRGGLIDVYNPFDCAPVRIDLWGDTIESIRSFDPSTQQTTEDLDFLHISPIREILFTQKTREHARTSLRLLGDELKAPSKQVNGIIKEIDAGYYFLGIEALLPAFYDLENPFDFLPRNATCIFVHPEEVKNEADTLWKTRINAYNQVISEEIPLAFSPSSSLLHPQEVDALFSSKYDIIEIHEYPPHGLQTLDFKAHQNDDVAKLHRSSKEMVGAIQEFVSLLPHWQKHYGQIAVACGTESSRQRIDRLLKGNQQKTLIAEGTLNPHTFPPPTDQVQLYLAPLSAGFRSPALGLAVVTDTELLGRHAVRKKRGKSALEEGFSVKQFKALSSGDHLVHLDFGLCLYEGMENLTFGDVSGDYLKLKFHGDDRLYLPVYRLGRVQKHLASESKMLRMDRLSGVKWAQTKARVKEDLRGLAAHLLALYAERKNLKGYTFAPPSDYFREFEASFPFEETPHQESAIEEVLADMCSPRPMDRLLCGDVGFGKTEVAMRAAFLASLSGKQVAILVPTTLLAEQHARSFQDRLKHFPVTVEALSRFRSTKRQKEIITSVTNGHTDILIGTHRILSKDVSYKNLGLLIIDEEQRFGVRHKERLTSMKSDVDVLTMTATPIPRTLEMSLLGVRDLSVILTPPSGRLAVQTHVAKYSPQVIKEAVENELRRGGQVFFVSHRVRGIEELAESIRTLLPDVRVAVAHAQMPNTQLERVMHQFIQREIDLLVCTTIIENGLDISSANTMLIHRADTFGLSQLYQLRGRIGRGRNRAICYLLVSNQKGLSPDAARRLEVLRSHTELGSGLYIAQHDLDIRGAGDLLGKDQSGHIRSVGYELFCELLEEAIREHKGDETSKALDPEVHLPVTAYIPEDYIADQGLKLLFYKRLSLAKNRMELDAVFSELVDRFGRQPEEVNHLREILEIKLELMSLGIRSLEGSATALVFKLDVSCRLSPDKVVKLVENERGRVVLREDMSLIWYLLKQDSAHIPHTVQKCLVQLNGCLEDD
jgi:transcription-repair coupling factor (superfamily II helicase)